MYVCHVHAWCPWKAEEGSGSHGTVVTGGCEALSPCKSSHALKHWAISLAPDLELLVLLNG